MLRMVTYREGGIRRNQREKTIEFGKEGTQMLTLNKCMAEKVPGPAAINFRRIFATYF